LARTCEAKLEEEEEEVEVEEEGEDGIEEADV
jgi:hypothetical protein